TVATAGDASQLGRQPAADGVVVVVGQVGIETVVEGFDFRDAHGPPAVGAGLEDGFLGFFVELVFDVADDLLQDVFHGDQPGNAAVFVDDDGQVVAAAAEVV